MYHFHILKFLLIFVIRLKNKYANKKQFSKKFEILC